MPKSGAVELAESAKTAKKAEDWAAALTGDFRLVVTMPSGGLPALRGVDRRAIERLAELPGGRPSSRSPAGSSCASATESSPSGSRTER